MKNFINSIKYKILLLFDNLSNKPKRYPIRLSQKEREFLIEIFKNSNNCLEFGSGGSTFLVLLHSNARITSVESDINWINYLLSWKIVRQNLSQKLKFHYVDIGPIGEWGVPTQPEANREKFPNYSSSVFRFNRDFGTVFVDGRFRVACLLQVILNCNKNTKILIHDFFKRDYYHVILNFLEIQCSTDSLALLKIKDNINNNDIVNLYEKYKYIWD